MAAVCHILRNVIKLGSNLGGCGVRFYFNIYFSARGLGGKAGKGRPALYDGIRKHHNLARIPSAAVGMIHFVYHAQPVGRVYLYRIKIALGIAVYGKTAVVIPAQPKYGHIGLIKAILCAPKLYGLLAGEIVFHPCQRFIKVSGAVNRNGKGKTVIPAYGYGAYNSAP